MGYELCLIVPDPEYPDLVRVTGDGDRRKYMQRCGDWIRDTLQVREPRMALICQRETAVILDKKTRNVRSNLAALLPNDIERNPFRIQLLEEDPKELQRS